MKTGIIQPSELNPRKSLLARDYLDKCRHCGGQEHNHEHHLRGKCVRRKSVVLTVGPGFEAMVPIDSDNAVAPPIRLGNVHGAVSCTGCGAARSGLVAIDFGMHGELSVRLCPSCRTTLLCLLVTEK